MASAEEIARGLKGRGAKKNKQMALDGFGVPGKDVIPLGWDEINPELIAQCVVAISRLGGAVMFGGSRGGDALSIGLYLDGDKKTVWLAGDADLDALVSDVIQRLEAMAD